jgi:hypothetical protein
MAEENTICECIRIGITVYTVFHELPASIENLTVAYILRITSKSAFATIKSPLNLKLRKMGSQI